MIAPDVELNNNKTLLPGFLVFGAASHLGDAYERWGQQEEMILRKREIETGFRDIASTSMS
ncbi:hypothetical protein [Nitrosospira sp. Nsp1]|uniref:hypothetical protein n=1 Tax=Nitrosospira sp. Nsp1 TaxID=136547 RepID=UPI000B80BD14|nr:hypothetical protein [Nitrosospira sp. Nsp1]